MGFMSLLASLFSSICLRAVGLESESFVLESQLCH